MDPPDAHPGLDARRSRTTRRASAPSPRRTSRPTRAAVERGVQDSRARSPSSDARRPAPRGARARRRSPPPARTCSRTTSPEDARARASRVRCALVFIESYRELPLLAWPREVLDGLTSFEQAFVIFRQRHARMVERMIGRRTGTGRLRGRRLPRHDRAALPRLPRAVGRAHPARARAGPAAPRAPGALRLRGRQLKPGSPMRAGRAPRVALAVRRRPRARSGARSMQRVEPRRTWRATACEGNRTAASDALLRAAIGRVPGLRAGPTSPSTSRPGSTRRGARRPSSTSTAGTAASRRRSRTRTRRAARAASRDTRARSRAQLDEAHVNALLDRGRAPRRRANGRAGSARGRRAVFASCCASSSSSIWPSRSAARSSVDRLDRVVVDGALGRLPGRRERPRARRRSADHRGRPARRATTVPTKSSAAGRSTRSTRFDGTRRFVDLYTCCGGTLERSRAMAVAASQRGAAAHRSSMTTTAVGVELDRAALAFPVVFARVPEPHEDLPRARFRALWKPRGSRPSRASGPARRTSAREQRDQRDQRDRLKDCADAALRCASV